MPIIFTTAGWTGAAIVWTHADGAATYTVGEDVTNPYDVAVSLQEWLDSAMRPWAAHVSLVTLTVEADADDRRLRFAYGFTGSDTAFTKAPNATWVARFGDTSASPPGSCPSSCSGVVATTMWEQWELEAGERSREGSFRFTAGDVAARVPSCELSFTREQAFAYGAAKRLASQPRRAVVYDEQAEVWRAVACGQDRLEHPQGDYTLLTGTLDIVGGFDDVAIGEVI